MDCTKILRFSGLLTTQSALHYRSHSPQSHAPSYNDGHAGCQTAHQRNLLIHKHLKEQLFGGLSVLPKDMSTCELEELGIKAVIFWLVDVLLYFLTHSHSNVLNTYLPPPPVLQNRHQPGCTNTLTLTSLPLKNGKILEALNTGDEWLTAI